MNTKDKIKIMQAWVDGKKIEVFDRGCNDWEVLTTEPNWNWLNGDYRIKPEPSANKVRPGMITEVVLRSIETEYPDVQEVDFTDLYFKICVEAIPDAILAKLIIDHFKQLYGESDEEK